MKMKLCDYFRSQWMVLSWEGDGNDVEMVVVMVKPVVAVDDDADDK